MPVGVPLEFVMQRRPSANGSTVSDVTLIGAFWCYVAEDVIREVKGEPVERWKVPGATAIPEGVYQVISTMSQRFGRRLLLLVDVPGFDGIRIHPGNSAADTEGCLLPGLSEAAGVVFRSREACTKWQDRIETALLAGRQVVIDIRNP